MLQNRDGLRDVVWPPNMAVKSLKAYGELDWSHGGEWCERGPRASLCPSLLLAVTLGKLQPSLTRHCPYSYLHG